MEFLSFHVVPCHSAQSLRFPNLVDQTQRSSALSEQSELRSPSHPLPCQSLVDSGPRPGSEKPRRSGKSRAVPFFVRVPVCSSGVALSRSSPAHRHYGRSFVIVHSSSFSRDGTKNLSSVWQDVMANYSMAILIASHSTSGGVAEVEVVFSNSFHHLNILRRTMLLYDFVLRSLGLKESWLNGPPISGHALLPRRGPKLQMYFIYRKPWHGPETRLLFE